MPIEKSLCSYFWSFQYGLHDLWRQTCDESLISFQVFLLSLMRNGFNMSTPQWANEGSSFSPSSGKSAIICSTTFPLSLMQDTHLEITFFTAKLPCITQYPEDLISMRVMFLPHVQFSDDTTLLKNLQPFHFLVGWWDELHFHQVLTSRVFLQLSKFHSCQWINSSRQFFQALYGWWFPLISWSHFQNTPSDWFLWSLVLLPSILLLKKYWWIPFYQSYIVSSLGSGGMTFVSSARQGVNCWTSRARVGTHSGGGKMILGSQAGRRTALSWWIFGISTKCFTLNFTNFACGTILYFSKFFIKGHY